MKTYRLTLAFLLLILVVPQVGADEPQKFVTANSQVPLMSQPDPDSKELRRIKAFQFLLSQAKGDAVRNGYYQVENSLGEFVGWVPKKKLIKWKTYIALSLHNNHGAFFTVANESDERKKYKYNGNGKPFFPILDSNFAARDNNEEFRIICTLRWPSLDDKGPVAIFDGEENLTMNEVFIGQARLRDGETGRAVAYAKRLLNIDGLKTTLSIIDSIPAEFPRRWNFGTLNQFLESIGGEQILISECGDVTLRQLRIMPNENYNHWLEDVEICVERIKTLLDNTDHQRITCVGDDEPRFVLVKRADLP